MDPTPPRLEIFAPFGEAFELTKKILFQPFDLGKWFVIGFAAWLATFFNGAGFNYRRSFNASDWSWTARHEGTPFSIHDAPPWVIPLVIVGILLLLALAVLLLWLNARGRFMFTDCIVRNRGAIAEPWREYHQEGNRYFVLNLVVAFCSLVLCAGLGLLFLAAWYWGHPVIPVALLILLAVVLALVLILVGMIMKFIVPVMYRQRCGAMDAFQQVWALIVAYPGIFLLFLLFYIVVGVAGAMIGCVAACATCCLAALPYIGTVILLPVVMILFAFPLCFLRQFGEQYDVWAVVRPTEPLPPPPPIPPVQESSPPA